MYTLISSAKLTINKILLKMALIGFMVFNATFNNISALLVEETGGPGENHWPGLPLVTDKLYHDIEISYLVLLYSINNKFCLLIKQIIITLKCFLYLKKKIIWPMDLLPF